jgi:hypothetical protein
MPDWNILFVTFDQWRGDCLSAIGHPILRTPHLDALAAEGGWILRSSATLEVFEEGLGGRFVTEAFSGC